MRAVLPSARAAGVAHVQVCLSLCRDPVILDTARCVYQVAWGVPYLANEGFNSHDVALARERIVKKLRAANAVCDIWGHLAGLEQPGQGQVWVAVRHQRVLHMQLHNTMESSAAGQAFKTDRKCICTSTCTQ